MSINVCRGGLTHDIALSRAHERGIDVVLVQEPWWSSKTKSHPGYHSHILHSGINVGHRAVTYTRINEEISAFQIFPVSQYTGAYRWVTVNGVKFLNVYKAYNDNSAIHPLINWKPQPWSIVAGDFNSIHLA